MKLSYGAQKLPICDNPSDNAPIQGTAIFFPRRELPSDFSFFVGTADEALICVHATKEKVAVSAAVNNNEGWEEHGSNEGGYYQYLFYARDERVQHWLNVDTENNTLMYGVGEIRIETALLKKDLSSFFIGRRNCNVSSLTHFSYDLSLHGVMDVAISKDHSIVNHGATYVRLAKAKKVEQFHDTETIGRRGLTGVNKDLLDEIEDLEMDEGFPELYEAVEASLTSGWCRDRIYTKYGFSQAKLGVAADVKQTYLRIPIKIKQGRGKAPGDSFVLEIWPPGHCSTIHNHDRANAVVKVLTGKLTVELFAALSPMVREPFATKKFEAGDITFLEPELNQTHRLKNETDKVVVTLQCYQYSDNDQRQSRTGKFSCLMGDGIDDVVGCPPKEDMFFMDFKKLMKSEHQQRASVTAKANPQVCEFIFGFGSIMNTGTHATWLDKDASGTKTSLPGRVVHLKPEFGYERRWNFQSNTGFTALGVSKTNEPKHSMNGVLFKVPSSMMPAFDKREKGYKKVLVPLEHIGFPTSDSDSELPVFELTAQDKVWIYVPENQEKQPNFEHPLLQSYLDTVLLGCFEWGGEEMAKDFVLSTIGWCEFFLNDRTKARRPWEQQPDFACVDAILEKHKDFTHFPPKHSEQYSALQHQADKKIQQGFCYYRFTPLRVRGSPAPLQGLPAEVQVSYFFFCNQGRDVEMADAVAIASDPVSIHPASDALVQHCSTKWFSKEISESCWWQVKFPNRTAVDAFGYVTGDDLPQRDPIDWKLEGSLDGTNFVTIQEVAGATITTLRKKRTDNFMVGQPTVTTERDLDDSRKELQSRFKNYAVPADVGMRDFQARFIKYITEKDAKLNICILHNSNKSEVVSGTPFFRNLEVAAMWGSYGYHVYIGLHTEEFALCVEDASSVKKKSISEGTNCTIGHSGHIVYFH